MFLLLLGLWLIFAGSVTPGSLALGAVVSGLVTLFCTRFMGYDTKRFYTNLREIPDAARYVLVLLREMLREAFLVIGWIWGKREPAPTLVRFRSTLDNEALRVLVANSITLTPGTYTVKLEGQEYAVHALDDSFQPGIEYSEFFRLAKKLEEH